jgi:16S rRNA (cytosine1402-N4)-methyltransferase
LFRHIGIDQDATELGKTKDRLAAEFGSDFIAKRVEFRHQNFGGLGSCGLHGQVHFLLADLGFSSMQIDDPTRGFTYKAEGPLDMRMDTTQGETAYELLSRLKRKELMAMLEENR